MKNTSLIITIPQLFTSISTLSVKNKSNITTLCFNAHETFQINQSNYLISNNTFNQDT